MLAVRANCGDQGFVDAAGEDHDGSVPGLGVGDTKTRDELAFFAHFVEGAGKLDASAVDDGDLVSVGDEIGDSFSGGVEDLGILNGDTA